jgi:hypothetical protein
MVVPTSLEFDMKLLKLFISGLLMLPALANAELQVVVLEGLGGEDRYAEQFAAQVSGIEAAASALTSDDRVQVFRSGDYSRDAVVDIFAELDDRMQADDRLALFLIGHGSYDDHEYKFNIAGPDLTDSDLSEMLDDMPGSNQLIVNTGSSSGAIMESLQRDDRTLILATKSGVERHATRFGNYFVAALSSDSADIDKNRIVTAQEAFQFADRQVSDYFERNGQLATEHPQIEGSQAARFGLARLGTQAPVTSDAELRRLVAIRDELNSDIEELRLRRDSMTASDYQAELLRNMLELAGLEDQIELREAELEQ